MGGFVKLIFLVLVIVVSQQHVVFGHNDGGTADEPPSVTDLRAKGLIDVKIYCLVILLVATFAGGVSPYFLRWNENFLLLGTQFAGGVFLGTSMMHFLADANSTVQDLTTKAYPFVYMLACVGYLLTMLGDILVHFVANRSRKKATKVDATSSVAEEKGREERNIDMNLHEGFVKANTLGDTILLIFALCFHSVFEGIAIGVADTKANAWKNLWTISLHKIFAAIAMGIALLRMLPKRPLLTTAAYALAFAVSSPVGVGIGIAIDATTQGRVADWIFVVSMGIATGVFVYVAIVHLIAKGFVPQHQSYFDTPFFKFLAVAVGVGVIAVVMIWD